MKKLLVAVLAFAVGSLPALAAAQEQKDAPPTAPPAALRLDGGYAAHKLYSFGDHGADLGVAAGLRAFEHGAFWGATRLMLGSSTNGLDVYLLRLGGEGEAVFGRFRFGGGLSLLVAGVGRAARDETLWSFGPELRATARVDVVQEPAYALFLRAEADGAVTRDGANMSGVSLGAGVEFDFVRAR